MALNVTPHIPQVVVNAAAPTTEALVRSNAQKEVVPAPVQIDAAVPQKSRDQEARESGTGTQNATYDNIFKNQSQVIPDDPQQQSQQEESSGQSSNYPSDDTADSNESEDNRQPAAQNRADKGNGEEDSGDEIAEKEDAIKRAEDQQEKQQESQELKQIRQLESRDQEVRAHEIAHAAVGGSYAGSPSYEYETGPNGKKYAVGGEVQIDVSKEATPQETIEKMQTVRAAALAPAEPSSQDRKVAAEASQNIAEARMEMLKQNAEQRDETTANVSQSFEKSNEIISRVASVVADKYQSSYQDEPTSRSEFSAVA